MGKQMPRMKTPKGYYTMTDTAKILDVSTSMVRKYVEKGRISYLRPEGREHGFYLKSDVDKLANEINAFFNIDEGEVTFMRASKDDLQGIVRVANLLFSNDTTENPSVPQWRYDVLEKNPETQYALKRGSTVIGFATVLPFKPNSEKIDRLLVSDRVSDAEISKQDIETFQTGNKIHLYIAGIGVDSSIENHKRKEYGARIVRDLISTIVKLGYRGIIIEKIFAQGATYNGVRLLQAFGLHEIPERAQGKRAFIMDIQESGAPVSKQYKQALKDSSI